MMLNRTPGRFAIRIVASKEQARAGIVSFQYVAEPKTGTAPAMSSKSGSSWSHGPLKWVVIGALAAGAGTAGALLAGRSGGAASPAPAQTSTTPAAPATITIGSPTLSVGKP
jgi:hypothetical protein